MAGRLVRHVHRTPLFKRSFGPGVTSAFARRPQFRTITPIHPATRLATRYGASRFFSPPFRFLAGGLLARSLDRTGAAGWRRIGAKNAYDLGCHSSLSK